MTLPIETLVPATLQVGTRSSAGAAGNETKTTAGEGSPAATPAAPALKVVGLDLSLTSTGVASATGADTLNPPSRLRGFERMRWIRGRVQDWVDGADLVVVEAPAYSSNQARAKEIAGLWHVVMIAVDARGLRWIDVMSNSLKMYATGKGRCDKSAVLAAAIKRLPIDVSNDDEADASWLCAMGHELLGRPIVNLPHSHRAALNAVRARFDAIGDVA